MNGLAKAGGGLGLACSLSVLLGSSAAAAEAELDFTRRVEAQRAIEAVHYAHRLEVRRPFADAVPEALLESKVRTYLKQSLLLDRRWNTPVTAAALHTELRRIADSSLLPKRLEEIYAALGHDTRLIEETFARATLVDRLARSFFSADHRIHAEPRAEAERIRSELHTGVLDAGAEHTRRAVHEIPKKDGVGRRAGASKQEPIHERRDAFVVTAILDEDDEATRVAVYTIPKVTWESWWRDVAPDLDESRVEAVATPHDPPPVPRSIDHSDAFAAAACHPSGQWLNGSLDFVRTPRYDHTAVWTGQLMLVWGGSSGPAGTPPGERYDPLTDSWSPMSPVNEPAFLGTYTTVWTGTEMILWGGYTNTGKRYDPEADAWNTVSTVGAPSARESHSAVWTGSHMVIWGGGLSTSTPLADGGRYDPLNDTWSTMATAGAPSGRLDHSATYAGGVMVVWGGIAGGAFSYLDTGGRYDPANDTWSSLTTQGAPTGRVLHTAVSTGPRMIVWGGVNGSGAQATGGVYDPATDSWAATSTTGVVSSGYRHTAVWTGTEMIVWGGYFDARGAYDPAANTWRALSRVNAPYSRTHHSAVWTGSLMIIWGGDYDAGGAIVSTGGRYDPAVDVWTPVSAPGGQYLPTIVWTGNQMIVWGGVGDNNLSINAGARYDPLTDVWSHTSAAGAPAPRSSHTAVWTGSEMIVWGGLDLSVQLDSGGRYDPVTDAWVPTSRVGAPSARATHRAVWTGSRMIVWGGASSGGRYDPATDTWSPTSLVDQPAPRDNPAMVWTGSEAIVWGGTSGSTWLTSGGRYDPVAETWRPTSLVSAPPGRYNQGAVWTGSLMVAWGGTPGSSQPLIGGRYHPETDTWMPMASSGTLIGGDYKGVWTGMVLILWDGRAGATYHPYLNTWEPVPTAGAPAFFDDGRTFRAVWDGEGMILWGTRDIALTFGDSIGGRYVLAPDISQDNDGDGFTVCGGDCSDDDARVRPGGPQTCDGVNNDCGHPFWPSLTATNETTDGDGDTRVACLDCDDDNASVWATPSVAPDLDATGGQPASLSWGPPASPGASAVRYDLMRSEDSSDFGGPAVCVESDDAADVFAVDADIPALGTVFYYLVRAENACPGALGVGPLGSNSQGQPRSGRACP